MNSNKEKTNKVEIKLSLDKDTVEFLELMAEQRDVSLHKLIKRMLKREIDYMEFEPNYLTGCTLNPRAVKDEVNDLLEATHNVCERLSELLTAARNAA